MRVNGSLEGRLEAQTFIDERFDVVDRALRDFQEQRLRDKKKHTHSKIIWLDQKDMKNIKN